MKKLIAYLTTILTLCSLSAAVAFAEPSASDDHPGALFLPSSYEQYLELTKPSDFAISDRYQSQTRIIKALDSAVIYLYVNLARVPFLFVRNAKHAVFSQFLQLFVGRLSFLFRNGKLR